MAMFETSMSALHGWHPGEIAIQDLLGYTKYVQTDHTMVRDHMPDQHRVFHTSNIAFVPLTTLDGQGRPWVSLVASKTGSVGFVSSPSERELVIDADVWPGDPIVNNVRTGERALVAGLGIEWATRRRNKFAGVLKDADLRDGRLRLELNVTQALGNCPKYINVRTVGPAATSPRLVHERLDLADGERLPDEVIDFIHRADAVFIGSSYVADPDQQEMYPSHLGTNHRGGRPGFVRVRNDGFTLVLPDYSGNRFMNSLGNIQKTPVGAITILDFETGDILYLTGRAKNVIGQDAQRIMPRTNLLTLFAATGYIFVRDAMPVRQLAGSKVYPSPYNPAVRYLAEEKPAATSVSDVTLTLERIQIHSPSLATFYFASSSPVSVRPGQAAIIDMNSFVGSRGYQHMARTSGGELSLNDDGIHTWTVSGQTETGSLMITMREKPGGYVTSRLFAMIRKMEHVMPGLLEDARPVGLAVQLVGVDGEFVLPKVDDASPKRLLWIAGGVGITPFLSMLRGVSREGGKWDIVLALAARRGDVEAFGRLVAEALQPFSSSLPSLTLRVVVYSTGFDSSVPPNFGVLPNGSPIPVRVRSQRLSKSDLSSGELDTPGREAYVCGPLEMEELALQGMKDAGIDTKAVHRENFAY